MLTHPFIYQIGILLHMKKLPNPANLPCSYTQHQRNWQSRLLSSSPARVTWILSLVSFKYAFVRVHGQPDIHNSQPSHDLRPNSARRGHLSRITQHVLCYHLSAVLWKNSNYSWWQDAILLWRPGCVSQHSINLFIPRYKMLHGMNRRSESPYLGSRNWQCGLYAGAFVWRCIHLERCESFVKVFKIILSDEAGPFCLIGRPRTPWNSTGAKRQTCPIEHGKTASGPNGVDRYNSREEVSRAEGVHRLETVPLGYSQFSVGAREEMGFDSLSRQTASRCTFHGISVRSWLGDNSHVPISYMQ